MKYKISEYAKLNNVTVRTVWNWIYRGDLKIEHTPTGRVRILVDEEKEKKVAVYARVSSAENKGNLDSQAERLVLYCMAKGYKIEKVVKEIGSGLNDCRPKLESLLTSPEIDIIVAEHKDRIARFGVNYLEKLLALNGRKLEIVNSQDDDKGDLMQDFVSIITSFCARLYGLRRSKRKTEEIIKSLENENHK